MLTGEGGGEDEDEKLEGNYGLNRSFTHAHASVTHPVPRSLMLAGFGVTIRTPQCG